MLTSIVIQLQAVKSGSIPADCGRSLQAVFLGWIDKIDPTQASLTHGEGGSEVRQYTISDLHGPSHFQNGRRAVSAGDPFWIRITSVTAVLSAYLASSEFEEAARAELISIQSFLFRVTGICRSPQEHPLAGRVHLASLLQERLFDPCLPPADLSLEFFSPTTFRSNGKNLLLPVPERIAASWVDRWNAAASQLLSLDKEDALIFTRENVFISAFEMKTAALHTGKATILGFQGCLSMKIFSDDPYYRRILHLLADFSFFCGTGAKTSIGMGQTRCLDEHYS